MAFEAYLILVQLNFTFFFLILTTILIFAILTFFPKLKPYCSCHICRSYLTSSWSLEYNNLCDWYTHLIAESPTGTIHVHVLNNVITANHQNVEYILKTKFHNFPKGSPFSAILGDLLGRGIFNVDGDLWKFQRKIASLELGTQSVKSYASHIIAAEIHSRLIPLLLAAADDKQTPFLDLQDVFRRFSFDCICKFSFGFDPCCLKLSLPVSEFSAAFDLASKLSAERAITTSPLIWKLKRLLSLGSEKRLKTAIKSVHELAEGVIKHKRLNKDDIDISNSKHEDLLSRFMAVIDDDEFLRDIVISFLLAGRDTVASALTTFFWLLSENPDAVESIRRESDRVMGARVDDDASTFDRLQQMHYLQAAVHESLRLFPPVQFDSKFCQSDDVLPDGTFVAGGTRVTYHPYAMGRMERVWGPDCMEFRPERWLRNGVFEMEDPFKYPVFQAGPRVCLGREMAVVEMKIVALSVIWQFDVRVAASGRAPKFVPGLTATVSGGLPVVVRQRKQ